MNYINVNAEEYVKYCISNGVEPFMAEKFARIIARPGVEGETVISWSVDEAGNPIVEKTDQVELETETGKPGWVVTKADSEGNPIIDLNGNLNQWIIKESTFIKKYEVDPSNVGLFKPKGGPQMFIQIQDNIILEQWGSKMQIAAGGYINITNPGDYYGISQRDFNDTYKAIGDDSRNRQVL